MRPIRRLGVIILLGWPALAQQFDLGLSSDPCSGGLTYTIPFQPPGTTDATLRYDRYGTSFTCTFPASPSPFVLTLGFVEPTVTGTGQRLFRVLANDIVVLDQFDAFAACGYRRACSRSVVLAGASTLTLRFVTQLRSAIISSVSIAPLAALETLTAIYDFGVGLITTTIPDPDGGPPTVHVRVDDTVVQFKGVAP